MSAFVRFLVVTMDLSSTVKSEAACMVPSTGSAAAAASEGISFDLIGSDDLEVSERVRNRRTNFLNLRGDRILRYILGLFVMLSGHKRRYFISFGTTSSNTSIGRC